MTVSTLFAGLIKLAQNELLFVRRMNLFPLLNYCIRRRSSSLDNHINHELGRCRNVQITSFLHPHYVFLVLQLSMITDAFAAMNSRFGITFFEFEFSILSNGSSRYRNVQACFHQTYYM